MNGQLTGKGNNPRKAYKICTLLLAMYKGRTGLVRRFGLVVRRWAGRTSVWSASALLSLQLMWFMDTVCLWPPPHPPPPPPPLIKHENNLLCCPSWRKIILVWNVVVGRSGLSLSPTLWDFSQCQSLSRDSSVWIESSRAGNQERVLLASEYQHNYRY